MLRRLLEWFGRDAVFKRQLPRDLGGTSFFVSPEGGLRFWRRDLRSVDKALFDHAVEYVRQGAVVWDIGANVGLFTFLAATRAGPQGHVLAVEPDTWLCELLRRSARVNAGRIAPVDVLSAAASDAVGILMFHIARRARSANHLDGIDNGVAGGTRELQWVVTVTLDCLLDHFRAPDLVKIDVEGAEVRVLAGSERLLSGPRPTILCEVREENCDAVAAIFSRAAYVVFDGSCQAERRPLKRAVWDTVAVPEERCAAYKG